MIEVTCLVEHVLALPYFNGKRKNDSQIAHSKVMCTGSGLCTTAKAVAPKDLQ